MTNKTIHDQRIILFLRIKTIRSIIDQILQTWEQGAGTELLGTTLGLQVCRDLLVLQRHLADFIVEFPVLILEKSINK